MRWVVLIFTICSLLGSPATVAAQEQTVQVTNPEALKGEWLLLGMADKDTEFVTYQTMISFNGTDINESTQFLSRTCKDYAFGNGVAMTLENCPPENIQAHQSRFFDSFEAATSLAVSKSGRYMWITDDQDKEIGFFQKHGHVSIEPQSAWDLLLKNSYKKPTHWELIEMKGLDAAIQYYLTEEDVAPANFDWKKTGLGPGLGLKISTRGRYRSVGFGFHDICKSVSWVFDRRDAKLKFHVTYGELTNCSVAVGNDEDDERIRSYYSHALWKHIAKVAPKFHHVDVSNEGQTLVLKSESLETLASFKRVEQ